MGFATIVNIADDCVNGIGGNVLHRTVVVKIAAVDSVTDFKCVHTYFLLERLGSATHTATATSITSISISASYGFAEKYFRPGLPTGHSSNTTHLGRDCWQKPNQSPPRR